VAAKCEKLLVQRKQDFAIIEAKEDQKFDKKLPITDLETMVDPVAEWHQIFTDAWRFERDYFYDPEHARCKLGRHAPALRRLAQRRRHALGCQLRYWRTHRRIEARRTLTGAAAMSRLDWSAASAIWAWITRLENGAYRIKKIIDDAPWDAEGPLAVAAARRQCEGRATICSPSTA
jgi:tricorn protease